MSNTPMSILCPRCGADMEDGMCNGTDCLRIALKDASVSSGYALASLQIEQDAAQFSLNKRIEAEDALEKVNATLGLYKMGNIELADRLEARDKALDLVTKENADLRESNAQLHQAGKDLFERAERAEADAANWKARYKELGTKAQDCLTQNEHQRGIAEATAELREKLKRAEAERDAAYERCAKVCEHLFAGDSSVEIGYKCAAAIRALADAARKP